MHVLHPPPPYSSHLSLHTRWIRTVQTDISSRSILTSGLAGSSLRSAMTSMAAAAVSPVREYGDMSTVMATV
ncbi:uncharacterized protein H6S33_005639 [Morchella sextelata]|uniref:uncharacterized protein n=1 Tax=Morchella sextelata TaxID=1174677 RepID=UPI001D04D8F1|nr:uncharacterized protein H6S33_005639 [Morchella sextelata]KAH0613753.1 hypothetical protein H6S33_005639 [Morchella sextelata]